LKFMTKNAYMDTACNSNGFCKAAHHAATVLLAHAGEVATLNTTTLVFQLSGITGIGVASTLVAHLLCEYWDELNNPESPQYVENRLVFCLVAGVIGALVCAPFMLLLDQVSDTLLFCQCLEKKRTPPEPPYQDDADYDRAANNLCGCCCGTPPARSLPFNTTNGANGPERHALMNGY